MNDHLCNPEEAIAFHPPQRRNHSAAMKLAAVCIAALISAAVLMFAQ